MPQPTKRNREPIQSVDLLNLEADVYLDEKGYGQIHPMTPGTSYYGEKDYVYKGTIRKGEVAFIHGEKLELSIPEIDGYDHGFTLEGLAKDIFRVDDGLSVYNPMEHRTFCYTNSKSKLVFIGDSEKEFTVHIRIFETKKGPKEDRWVVIYAE